VNAPELFKDQPEKEKRKLLLTMLKPKSRLKNETVKFNFQDAFLKFGLLS
tara:strand:+ start:519 stop:668 length:150 start_codon:yes stop_codon:yes gene_type:complete